MAHRRESQKPLLRLGLWCQHPKAPAPMQPAKQQSPLHWPKREANAQRVHNRHAKKRKGPRHRS